MKTHSILQSNKIPAALRAVLLPAAVCATLATASAQVTYTWSNAGGTNLWGNSTNWVGSPTLTFGNQTDIIFDNASVVNPANAISINGNRIIRSLTINADYATSNNATFDIRTLLNFNDTNRNLTFEANTGNASITLAQSTTGTVQVRLGGNNAGTTILNSNLDIAQNNTFLDTAGNGLQFDGSVSGNGTINKTGAGLVRMVRDNSGWAGGMNINEGEVSVFGNGNNMGNGTWTIGGGGNNTTFSVGSVAVQNNTGGLVVAAGAGTRTIALMSTTAGNPTLSGNITLNKDAIFDVGNYVSGTHDRLTANGTISGTGGIVKTNTGILILEGTNTYSGNTTVSAGTLVVNGDQSAATGAVSVGVSGTLGGNGTIGGATTISSTHSPGNSPGLQTFESGLTYTTNSTFVWELTGNTAAGRGTSFDGVDVTGGTLTIQTGVSTNLVFNGIGSSVLWSDTFWDSDQNWLVFDNANLPSILGIPTISLSQDSGSNNLGDIRALASFSWDVQGNDVYLNYTAIPEPSAAALLAGSLAALMVFRRRRR